MNQYTFLLKEADCIIALIWLKNEGYFFYFLIGTLSY